MTNKTFRRPRMSGRTDNRVTIDSDLLTSVQGAVTGQTGLSLSPAHAADYALRSFLRRQGGEAH